MVDATTIDWPTVLTSIIALITSLGGAAVLMRRAKAAKAVIGIADTLGDVGALLVKITDAQKDNTVTQEELEDINKKATEIYGQITDIRKDLGL